MAKATLLKSFEHNGRTYQIGNEFEGTEAEMDELARQGYIRRKAGDEALQDPGPGKGVNVSASSSGNAEVHSPPPAAHKTEEKPAPHK